MAFRSDNERRRIWLNWLDENRDELIRMGLPIHHFREERHWWYFLEHGYTAEFKLEWLSGEQQRRLLEFLLTQSDEEMRRTWMVTWLTYHPPQ